MEMTPVNQQRAKGEPFKDLRSMREWMDSSGSVKRWLKDKYVSDKLLEHRTSLILGYFKRSNGGN